MLTSAKIGKQNGDTRTRKTETGYLNLSNIHESRGQTMPVRRLDAGTM
jgi:hypothetical protein